MKEKIFNAFRVVVLAFILSSAIGYSLADWTPPSGTPPFNNVPPPINVGPTTQVKDGNLFINNLLWAKKARSVSTVGAPGCSPVSATCDSDDTLTTKDYVDMIFPSGAVMPFNLASCPTGWSDFTSANGRTIFGSSMSMSLLSTGGEKEHTLTIAEMPFHDHKNGLGHSINLEFDWRGRGDTSTDTEAGGASLSPDNFDSIEIVGDKLGPWAQVYGQGGGMPHNTMPPYIALKYCVKN